VFTILQFCTRKQTREKARGRREEGGVEEAEAYRRGYDQSMQNNIKKNKRNGYNE
jgi:hypothetical protein